MAHVRYTQEGDSPQIAVALAGSVALRGAIGSLHRAMAHAPNLLIGFEAFSLTIRKELPLDYPIFAIVCLRTVQATRDSYEWTRCQRIALQTGIPVEKVASLLRWEGASLFDPRERAALGIVDEHCLGRDFGQPAAILARAALREEEIVSVCAVMGWFRFCAALTMPLGLIDDDPPPDLPVGIDGYRIASHTQDAP